LIGGVPDDLWRDQGLGRGEVAWLRSTVLIPVRLTVVLMGLIRFLRASMQWGKFMRLVRIL